LIVHYIRTDFAFDFVLKGRDFQSRRKALYDPAASQSAEKLCVFVPQYSCG
jgi:hypothetical protein